VGLIGGHYWENQWFLGPRQIWNDLPRITHLPCALIHGRYDVVALARISYELQRAWPGSTLHIVERAGHMTSEPPIAETCAAVLDGFAAHLRAP